MSQPLDPEQAGRLFAVIRQIKGQGLSQTEVDALNRALMGEVMDAHLLGFQLGEPGQALIESFESYKATTYPDPGPTGKPVTGGWGTTRDENGQPFRLGVTHDQAYWQNLKRRDLQAVVTGVNLLIKGAPTSQNQFDALCSFAYNVGLDIDDDTAAEGLGDSTLLKKHLRQDYAGCAAEFAKWNKAKGVVLNGLTRRRKDEAALYLK